MERGLRTPKTGGVKPRFVCFRFFPNGNSATPLTTAAGTLRDPGGLVDNVTRTAQGNFEATMRDPAYRVTNAQATFQCAADNVDLFAQVGDITNEGTATPLKVKIKLKTAAVSTDPPAANTNSSVSVWLAIEDSAAGGVA